MNSPGNNYSQGQEAFGPGTDLIVSLVALLILLLVVMQIDLTKANEDLEFFRKDNMKLAGLMDELDSLELELRKKEMLLEGLSEFREKYEQHEDLLLEIRQGQQEIISEICRQFNVEQIITEPHIRLYEIAVGSNNSDIIKIENNVTSQRISFGESILFDKESAILKSKGRNVISKVGIALQNQLKNVLEIQVNGHADTRGEEQYNLDLAGQRAISVFSFLQRKANISPIQNIMSATSYGEYMPVNRSYSKSEYTLDQLKHDNDTRADRAKNRRIELVINFKETTD